VSSPAIQDFYPDDFAVCYGCGRLNEHGLHITSRVDGDEVVAVFDPRPYHLAVPGFVYGGLLASLLDCHSMATAAAAALRAEGREIGAAPSPRYVTASLHVDFLKPTPVGFLLEVRARAKEIRGRKVIVEASISAGGEVTVRGEVVAVQLPDHMREAAFPPTSP
jgi:acyl-coenzyme A thioesterase PaaI-like protein